MFDKISGDYTQNTLNLQKLNKRINFYHQQEEQRRIQMEEECEQRVQNAVRKKMNEQGF